MYPFSGPFLQFDLPFIKVFRVREWSFTAPEQKDDKEDKAQSGQGRQLRSQEVKTSVWNCDGEVLEQPSLHVR